VSAPSGMDGATAAAATAAAAGGRATAAPAPFGMRLRAAVAARGPLCVGIDPHPDLLRRWGLGDDPAGLERFALSAVDAVAGRVAVVKPQSAFYERFGSRGIAVLERVLAQIRAAGAIALLDAKRGDIGSTMAAYAAAYLDPAAPAAADAITASAYLGFESLRPALDTARAHGTGVFVLARTSNPEGAEVQCARAGDGRTVAQRIVDAVAAENAAERAAAPASVGALPDLGSTGVVIGATLAEAGVDLSGLCGPILAPGVGAQGGALADLPRLFGAALPDVLPAVSREILADGPDPARIVAAADRFGEQARRLLDR
jgi:orotidine 5'-phosphate decarboxylase subfamily 2